ncbi:hypothetical protein H5410_001850 [Solanum commersonii]|uniref:Uncharacterized protein n=1 Tax=Solanum commersonii TaxID=4109 RepID=A0A9J6AZZ1_SOLCO|nr:hypothetical protein H5410_001850 [Solanum commersonii]
MNAHNKTQFTNSKIKCALKDLSCYSPISMKIMFTILDSNANSGSTKVFEWPNRKNDSIISHNLSQDQKGLFKACTGAECKGMIIGQCSTASRSSSVICRLFFFTADFLLTLGLSAWNKKRICNVLAIHQIGSAIRRSSFPRSFSFFCSFLLDSVHGSPSRAEPHVDPLLRPSVYWFWFCDLPLGQAENTWVTFKVNREDPLPTWEKELLSSSLHKTLSKLERKIVARICSEFSKIVVRRIVRRH